MKQILATLAMSVNLVHIYGETFWQQTRNKAASIFSPKEKTSDCWYKEKAACHSFYPAHLEVTSFLSHKWMEQSELAGPLRPPQCFSTAHPGSLQRLLNTAIKQTSECDRLRTHYWLIGWIWLVLAVFSKVPPLNNQSVKVMIVTKSSAEHRTWTKNSLLGKIRPWNILLDQITFAFDWVLGVPFPPLSWKVKTCHCYMKDILIM